MRVTNNRRVMYIDRQPPNKVACWKHRDRLAHPLRVLHPDTIRLMILGVGCEVHK